MLWSVSRPSKILADCAALALSAALVGCGPSRIRAGHGADGDPQDLGAPAGDLSPSAPDLGPFPDLPMSPPEPVHVVLTADNAYVFGWGDQSQVAHLYGRPGTTSAGDIFDCPIGKGPEAYDVDGKDAPADAYLYVVAWCDDSTTQGLIGEFLRGQSVLRTGDAGWEVCATGIYKDAGNGAVGPTQDEVNAQLTLCNAGAVSTSTGSGGWVDEVGAVTPGAVGTLVFGEDNSDPGGDFPITCQMDSMGQRGVDAEAKWMWYLPPGYPGSDPFRHPGGHNPTRAFLIFRLPAAEITIQ